MVELADSSVVYVTNSRVVNGKAKKSRKSALEVEFYSDSIGKTTRV